MRLGFYRGWVFWPAECSNPGQQAGLAKVLGGGIISSEGYLAKQLYWQWASWANRRCTRLPANWSQKHMGEHLSLPLAPCAQLLSRGRRYGDSDFLIFSPSFANPETCGGGGAWFHAAGQVFRCVGANAERGGELLTSPHRVT